MYKTRTASDELIAYILSLTPEQVNKVINHPAFMAVVEEYRNNKPEEYAHAV